MKRTAMVRGRGARTKGGTGEREVVELLHDAGFPLARRNFQSGGQGGGDVVNVGNVHLEVKRCESVRVWQWIGQAESEARPTDVPVVAFRRSHSGWYAVLPFEDLLPLLKLRESL